MSQQQVQIFPHQQEQSKVIGKTDNGNYIVKVHLLSNTWALNGNRYDYNDVSELPESFLNELVGLPVVPDHLHHELTALHEKLKDEGKTECQIRDALVKRSKDISIGVLDDVYKPGKLTFNSMIPETELYGALEITNPEENKYIDEHGVPSKQFTSIGTGGEYIELEDGRTIYTDMSKVRPIHISFAKYPAFGKDKAKIRGVCKGEKTACKNKLMFQSLDNESINTDVNDNTNMSKQELKDVPPTPETKTAAPVKADHEPADQEKKEKEDQDSTLEKPAPENKETEPNKSEPKKESFDEDVSNKGGNKPDSNDTEARLAKLQQQLEDQTRTYRKSLLKFSVDPRAFKSEEELKIEQDRVMNIMETYNLKNDDAEWLVTKAFPKFQAPNDNKKGANPVYNSMTFDVSDVTKSQGSSTPTESKKERNNIIENEY